MANKFTDAVHHAQLPGRLRSRVVRKAILMAVAWHTDNKSGVCWPSYGLIAREANCSRQAVKENMPWLIELGVVSIVGKKVTRYGPVHMLKVSLKDLSALSDEEAERPGSVTTGKLDNVDQVAERSDQVAEQREGVAERTENSSLNSAGELFMMNGVSGETPNPHAMKSSLREGKSKTTTNTTSKPSGDVSPDSPVNPAPEAQSQKKMPAAPHSWGEPDNFDTRYCLVCRIDEYRGRTQPCQKATVGVAV